MPKQRADMVVVAQGLADSRTRAQALISLGVVLEDASGKVIDKAGSLIHADIPLRLKEQPIPFVGRGALKLRGAMDAYNIDVTGKDCLDVGASTGGFTDLMLQRGAARVVALDVGYNQLAYKLRQDPRVIVRERCNVRTAADDDVPFAVSMVTVDVSFISLSLVVPALPRWLLPGAWAVLLVKPQFEVGAALIGKGGIVTSAKAREQALERAIAVVQAHKFTVQGHLPSPIVGAKGNQEYLLVARWGESEGFACR